MTSPKNISAAFSPIALRAQGPILYIVYNSGATDEQYEEHLASKTRVMMQMVQEHSVMAHIHDATKWTRSSAKQRQLEAAWLKQHWDFLSRRCVGMSFVITSAFVRGGVTAVLWLSGFPMPYKVVETCADAERWVEVRLDSSRTLRVGNSMSPR